MGYSAWVQEEDCPVCGTHNFIVVGSAGVAAANEWEDAKCFKCGAVVAREKCLDLETGETAKVAAAKIEAYKGFRPGELGNVIIGPL